MNSEIKIIDILIYSNLLIVPLSIFLILIKNKISNFFFAIQFVLYQMSIYFFSFLFFLISIKSIKTTSIWFHIIGTFFFCLGCILYYLINKTILLKKVKLEPRDFLHIIPVLVIIAYLIIDYSSVYIFKSNYFLIEYGQMLKGIYFLNKSKVLIALRFIYPIIYLLFPIRLLLIFLIKPSVNYYPEQIKSFLFVLFISKITYFLTFILGIISLFLNFQFFSDIVKILFLTSTLILPIYLIVNHKIISIITNNIIDAKKQENSQSDKIDVIPRLNDLIIGNKLFLNTNYSIVNLSADSNISIIKIREKIKETGCINYSEFINSFKINYANSLIVEGYLNKFSIESLSKVSGFQSDVSFYRIFKKINGCTPTEFKNKVN